MSESEATIAETKILLADDEAGIRKVLGISLADSGYEVHTAASGAEALDIFRKIGPAIVLTDIKMPGMDGIELLQRIKAENPDTEVIMITGHGDMDLAIKSLKHEATDFVTKPINDDVLDIALKRAHERIDMRQQLREHTHNLEVLVQRQSARLVEVERLAAIGQAVDSLSTAMRDIAGDIEGGIHYFNEMPCLVSIHNRDLKVVASNQLYRERLGQPVGADSWSIYADGDATAETCPAAATFASGQGQRMQAAIRYPDGSRFTAMVHTAPIRDSSGKLELVLEISVDISEVERLREELRATQDRLTSLGLMVSSISHGVKGVLTGLDGGLYLLETGLSRQESEQITEGLDVVKLMAERIRKLVLNVLFYAKERPLEPRQIELSAFIDHLLSALTVRLQQSRIELVTRCDPAIVHIEADEGRLATAMTNIIENAIDACLAADRDRRHCIEFGVSRQADEIVFAVTDSGIGMRADARDNLFNLFYSSKGRMGTGLGLFIANQIVQEHGGRIEVTSAPGQGATFRVVLPRSIPAPRDATTGQAPAPQG